MSVCQQADIFFALNFGESVKNVAKLSLITNGTKSESTASIKLKISFNSKFIKHGRIEY